ncbi:MAG: O-antigen ligase family protein [Bacteroidetes bacterium]|jgi:hypothetical protein|nr:O-antigen ligase family protein [Bacteroidota bacterium]
MNTAPAIKTNQTYFVVLVLLAVSIPLSKFTMSVFQFALILVWFADGFSGTVIQRYYRKTNFVVATYHSLIYTLKLAASNFVDKFGLFFKNRIALIISSLFLLHLIGLLHTSDFNYALKDLRTKLPIFVIPLVMSTMPALSRKQVKQLLILYVLAVFIGTLFSMNAFFRQEFNDIRSISLFISSIRFALNILFAFFILSWFVFIEKEKTLLINLIWIVLMIWFVVFLMILESGVGLVSLVFLLTAISAYKAFTIKRLKWRIATIFLMIALPLSFYLYISSLVYKLSTTDPVVIENLDSTTAQGTHYVHDTINFGIEDGKYVGLYLAEPEMAKAWNQRSKLDYHGKDYAGQHLKYTLIRYLTSRDLRKDAAGVSQLSEKDIRAIENGIANINYLKNPSIRTRISKILLGYQQYINLSDPNGSSVLQRIEYLKASVHIIEHNFWIGVGTGDLPRHFENAYQEIDTVLKEKWQWRSHNQYLSILIGFGVFGLVWFLVMLLFPYCYNRNYRHFLYTIFLAIFLISMLTEDTIENQAGVTFFAFFNAFFLLAATALGRQSKDL